MNPARYRTRAARFRTVAGFTSPVPLRPLTRAELLGLELQIEDLSSADAEADLSARLEVLALSTGCGDLAEEIDLRELAALFEAWEAVQAEHMPNVDALIAMAELQLVEGCGVLLLDATAAAHSESPADFYGEAVASLSDGQLAYYLALKSAHAIWSDGKCPTLGTLRDRVRSANTKALDGELNK